MIQPLPFQLVPNPRVDRSSGFRSAALAQLPASGMDEAAAEIRAWPGYAPTPCLRLAGLAAGMGVGEVWYKHEGSRFGLQSFKALGGGYAVARIAARQVIRHTHAAEVSTRELLEPTHRHLIAPVTVTCATDGNHGRAVAWAAHTFGCQAVVFMASIVSPAREQAILSFGARVVRSAGNHDIAALECLQAAKRHGWFVVSETAKATERETPVDTLSGYATLLDEAYEQLPDARPPTHVFIQAGVGGLAAAAAVVGGRRWGAARPQLIVVEAEHADCVARSLAAGERRPVRGNLDTIMAGLAAGEVSELAWAILLRGADFGLTIPDAAAIATMRLLAAPSTGDPAVAAGESGVAGLAAALLVAGNAAARGALGLSTDSIILTVGTEGATDPDLYREFVGRGAEEIEAP